MKPGTDPAVLDELTTRLMRRTTPDERAAAISCTHKVAAIAKDWPTGPVDDAGTPLNTDTDQAWRHWQQIQDWAETATYLARLIALAEDVARHDEPRLI
ncbi:hypothetical protein CGZ93_10460 [Enemella dayhoffiae]|uniref:Uncharacterized protein n=1 Tax=Enemella dayhoffiae TaxID=2016507 RepID=A0A255H1E1_9ACTN|nr:hypothetical protein [Enemella dayhoffiae]OYO21491.1 hypothetical protein CGZ93_10460 [Enemella dayhoffiae]